MSDNDEPESPGTDKPSWRRSSTPPPPYDATWGDVPGETPRFGEYSSPCPHWEACAGPKLYEYMTTKFCTDDWLLCDPEHAIHPYWWQDEKMRNSFRESVRNMMYQHTAAKRWKSLPAEALDSCPWGGLAPWLSPDCMQYWVRYFKRQDILAELDELDLLTSDLITRVLKRISLN